MTTMDSDSESQDSDEGRRFRFEATRKDSLASLHSRKRRSSPARTDPKRRSRSFDRNTRDRRTTDPSRHDEKKSSRSNTNAKSRSRDIDSKTSKDAIEPSRINSRHRDHRDSKNSSNSSLNHRDPKSSRDHSPFNSSRRSSKTRDKRRSHERSTDRNYDEKIFDKHANKFGNRGNWNNSRERSRESSHQDNRLKITESTRKSSKNETKSETKKETKTETKNLRDKKKSVESTNNDKNKDLLSRLSSSSSKPECKDLNLSDFDIVSDIDENSSNDAEIFQSRERDEKRKKRDDDSEIRDSEMEMKKRLSKQQYERLLKRQATKQRRGDDGHKVTQEDKKCDRESGSSNNNRSTVSDFLLGDDSSTTTTTTTTTTTSKTKNLDDDKNNSHRSKTREFFEKKNSNELENSRSNDSSTFGPVLPAKDAKLSSRGDDETVGKISQSRDEEKIVPRVIGPTIPDHIRQLVDCEEMDVEDTFGPALPPHLEQLKDADGNSNDESSSFSKSTGKSIAFEEKDCEGVKRDEDEADDDDMMGPLPVDHPDLENDFVQQQLELRARRLKAELAACDEEDENKREEWMIELPPAQSANLGLGPRKFRVRPAPDMSDRSSWTDTPADRARKRMEKLENRQMVSEPKIRRERDAPSASSEREKSKKRQQSSLMELHQKKLHKKKKREEKDAKEIGKTAERRPFDRDIDLQANRFDEARKKSMFSKARELDDRFSRGKI